MKLVAGLVALAALPACTSSDYMRVDGVTRGAGDAIAANTVMQMVDPWQPGVEDADLTVPADRTLLTTSTSKDDAAVADAGTDD
ncbi:hypothetical protein BSQ44_13585 [Aquibium oceanicum]|uniref:Uncharacterized protein n=2 Tax=Aquibium oceanicum TaxID=1670800 RepID=A0A1L3SZ14_9HYPH|nr:hypothetical protein BSQ44_13585 [Aquibium oceanicum]